MAKRYPKEEREKEVKIEQIGPGLVQATNVLELPIIEPGEDEEYISVPIMAVDHASLVFNDMWADLVENHLGEIRKAIKKKAALYYNSLSPTTLQEMTEALQSVVINSANCFALICDAWRSQNCDYFEDEDGYDLSGAFNNASTATLHIGVIDQEHIANRPFHFGISNSDWKKKVLKSLKQIYLTNETADFIWTFMGHFVELDTAKDGVQRFFALHADASTTEGGHAGDTLDTLTAKIEEYVTAVDAAYNKYPFMDDLLEFLKMYNPGDKYDFTRDLAGMKLKVFADTDSVVEDLIYSTNVILNPGELVDEKDHVWFRIVKSTVRDGSYLKFYDDDKTSAASLVYMDRIQVSIRSYTNAFRGNLRPLNITYIQCQKDTNAKYLFYIGPFPMDGVVTLLPTTLVKMAEDNAIRDTLDMPNDVVRVHVKTVDGDEATVYTVNSTPCSGDYIISADDIESVISDATFTLLFGGAAWAGTEPANVQTLGNDGKNDQ